MLVPTQSQLRKRTAVRVFAFLVAFILATDFYRGEDERMPSVASSPQPLQTQTSSKGHHRDHDKVACIVCDEQHSPTRWHIQMTAIPHTASSTTNGFFANAMTHAWNTSLSLAERGFVCHNNINSTVVATEKTSSHIHACHQPTLSCLFQSLRYSGKSHQNYHELWRVVRPWLPGGDDSRRHNATRESRIFTTLRDPAQMITSQYKDRKSFDRVWDVLYNDTSLSQISIEEWAERAWWRHNLETKMLATTDTRLIWAGNQSARKLAPTQRDSDAQNALHWTSPWLATAIQRIKSMTAFALMHRLEESFDLYSFQFCIPGKVKWHSSKQYEYPISTELQSVVDRRFRLDLLLLQQAEVVFDQRVARMRRLKEKGWLCDLGTLLGYPDDVSVGIACEQ